MNHNLKINFHFTERCNFKCKFYFAPFASEILPFETLLRIIDRIAESEKCSAINFAGGEPTVFRRLPELIKHAHNQGLRCSLITNGYNLTDKLLADILPYLDKIGFSVHTFNKNTKLAISSCTNDYKILTNNRLEEICEKISTFGNGCKIKLNTVVCSLNKNEILVPFIAQLPVNQWKILRCQENVISKTMLVSDTEFETFCRNNVGFSNTLIENDMQNAYIIINPVGKLRQFDISSLEIV